MRKICDHDHFYCIMHNNDLMLKPYRKHHTTDSNHNSSKYKNFFKGFRPKSKNQLRVAI